jgi:hypothetical protein
MQRIVLTVPFIRHYAGSVFELDENTNRPAGTDWQYDRIAPEKTYWLPDAGKGLPADLPVRDTVRCPPGVFDQVDLCSGPCRFTSAETRPTTENGLGIGLDQLQLSANKQAVSIRFQPGLPAPLRLHIRDRVRHTVVHEQAVDGYAVDLSLSRYEPGFYELCFACQQQVAHYITFIKCFPLVVTVNQRLGTYDVFPTLY